ncbi:MAG TPA: valine--tRNA ligase [Chitinophagales bacterium]|nr:valine--tRNA ligase [Chitinophagales bacterium]HNE45757.1 valine--tRNA ligase [Chitinophagales bacterium]HNI55441.1 valine--tRNA ligase [Chitinophagales bacterium]HNJ89064.1 valine--tRNA ligase [Chitinophagales bacterium]HNM29605.1 valine--tRNA ligase [Chitinophagales bacterium]
MEISKTYDPASIEKKWYAHWLANRYFHSKPDNREPFTIVIPPPNVTGVLHMGHVLNNTIQDVLIRRARMQGKNACWVPGTDHASIATEAKVVKMLREQGIKKSSLSREDFLKHAWEWKEKYGGIILQQLKELGCSCDWDRTRFTMDDLYYDDVIDTFIDLYNKGYIYRGLRMVNWDPEARTALSNEEVIYQDVTSRLHYVKYQIKGDNVYLTVATTRPETILGDTAICVHPDDERYKEFIGKTVLVPLIKREIPVIADTYVDMEFGTGALKITPAHDPNDYEIGLRYNLPVIDIMNEDGTLSEKAEILIGEDRMVARKKMVAMLEEEGYLVKIEELKNSVGFSERTNAMIEPRLSMQWFISMKEISKPALEHVMNGDINLHPEKFINTYRHWMENVKDWCISRQLWWGQRIPAWYNASGEFVVAKTEAEAKAIFTSKGLSLDGFRQDEDVLDTWASSWLWPISVFNGMKDPKSADIEYYYPTQVLVTAPEILFFWVARMIIAGYEYRNEKPFSDVYLTGIVRDKLRRKMSKSLGNSPDPLDLIAQYGADAIRMGILLCSPAGNDIIYDDKLIEQGRNFNNKLWNVLRLIKGWEVTETSQTKNEAAIQWFDSKLNDTINTINDHFEQFRISDALMCLYNFIWDDFCSWYLEFIKPEFGQPIDSITYEKTIDFFEGCLKLLHPYMPFITEEIWHLLRDRKAGDDIVITQLNDAGNINNNILASGNEAKELISRIRDIRAKNNVSPKVAASLYAEGDITSMQAFRAVIMKMANLEVFESVTGDVKNAVTFLVGTQKFFVVVQMEINIEDERKKLEEQIAYQKGFLLSIDKKLSNEKFVGSAPAAVVDLERRKKADAEEKIRILEESLRNLGN